MNQMCGLKEEDISSKGITVQVSKERGRNRNILQFVMNKQGIRERERKRRYNYKPNNYVGTGPSYNDIIFTCEQRKAASLRVMKNETMFM